MKTFLQMIITSPANVSQGAVSSCWMSLASSLCLGPFFRTQSWSRHVVNNIRIPYLQLYLKTDIVMMSYCPVHISVKLDSMTQCPTLFKVSIKDHLINKPNYIQFILQMSKHIPSSTIVHNSVDFSLNYGMWHNRFQLLHRHVGPQKR